MHPSKKILVILLCTYCTTVFSQNNFDQNDFQKSIKVTDIEGKPFANPPIGIDGSPFFIENWRFGSIKLNGNIVYNNVFVRLNLESHEVHFLNQNKLEMVVSPETIKELFIYDTLNGENELYDFRCGLLSTDKPDEKNFYLVLSEGKVKLFELVRKEIRETRDALSGQVTKEFIAYENYYYYADNMLHPVKLTKSSILQLLPGQENLIENFVKLYRLSYKSGKDVKKIVDYYNTL